MTTLEFTFSKSSRPFADWRHDKTLKGDSPLAKMRAYAREHGAAGAFKCDDSYLLIYREGDKLRQKTWASAKPVIGG